MTVRMCDSFDFYAGTGDAHTQQGSGNLVWDTFTWGLSTNTRFSVGQSMQAPNFPTNATASKAWGSNDGTVILCCAYNGDTTGVAAEGAEWILYDGTTAQCSICFERDGAIRLRTGVNGTVLATYAGAFTSGLWNQFQCKVVISSTVGEFHVRTNGATSDSFSATGLNTQVSANAYCNAVTAQLFGTWSSHLFDDVLLMATGGTAPTDWPGDIRAVQQMPASDPATKTFYPFPATVSYTTGGGSAGAGLLNGVANELYFTYIVPTDSGLCTQLQAVFNSAMTGHMNAALYSDNAGVPGTLLGTATALTNPSGTATFNLLTNVPVAGGTKYWVALLADASFSLNNNNTFGVDSQQAAQTYGSGFPSTAPSVSVASNLALVYMVLIPANFDLVKDAQEDGDATYIYSQVAGNEDLFGISGLTTTPATILGVVGRMFCRKDNSGARFGAIQYKSAATEVNGASTNLSTTYGYVTTPFVSTDPNTSATWTETGVNNLLVGTKVTA